MHYQSFMYKYSTMYVMAYMYNQTGEVNGLQSVQ